MTTTTVPTVALVTMQHRLVEIQEKALAEGRVEDLMAAQRLIDTIDGWFERAAVDDAGYGHGV